MIRAWTKWGRDHHWATIAAGFCLLLFLVLVLEVVPRAQGAYAQYDLWQKQNEKLAAVDAWDQEKLEVAAERRRLRENYARLYVSLPRTDQISVVLEVLHRNARQTGTLIFHIKPGERLEQPAYALLPLDVKLKGGFHSIVDFINRIEQSRYLIKVNQVAIKAEEPLQETLTAQLAVSVIVLDEQTLEE